MEIKEVPEVGGNCHRTEHGTQGREVVDWCEKAKAFRYHSNSKMPGSIQIFL
jgi:hypothetical protein